MKNIRRALITASFAIAACGLATAGTITQTFNLPASGSQATNWSIPNSTGVQSYDYLQSLCASVCGNLTDVTVTMSYAATGMGSATDANTGSTGHDAYTFQSLTTFGLSADGGSLSVTGLASCSDSAPFQNESNGSVMNEPGCVGSGSMGPTDEFSLASFFQGANTVNDLTFTGSASYFGGFSGANFNNASSSGVADAAVTVVYTYSAPASVPEPTTLFLMGSALVGCGLLRKRIKSKQ